MENAGTMPIGSKLQQSVGTIREDISRLGSDVTGAAKDLAGAAYDTVRARGGQACDSTRSVVRDHPLAAVGIAFGAGLLLAALIRR